MHILLIQAPNWLHPMPFGPFETAEVADSFAERFRQENDLPREHTEGLWSFDILPLTTVVPQFGADGWSFSVHPMTTVVPKSSSGGPLTTRGRGAVSHHPVAQPHAP